MKVIQSCLAVYHPMDDSLSVPYAHGILEARRLEWVAIPFRGPSQPRD